MTTGQAKLRDLHFLLKDALDSLGFDWHNHKGVSGLSLPIKDYSFIDSDKDPLDSLSYPTYYLDELPKYAELTGLVPNNPEYNKMQDILNWFADNEDSLRETGFTKEEISEHPELKPRDPLHSSMEKAKELLAKNPSLEAKYKRIADTEKEYYGEARSPLEILAEDIFYNGIPDEEKEATQNVVSGVQGVM